MKKSRLTIDELLSDKIIKQIVGNFFENHPDDFINYIGNMKGYDDYLNYMRISKIYRLNEKIKNNIKIGQNTK